MNQYALVYPMAAMVALTAFVLGTMFRRRVRAVREQKLTTAYFREFRGGTEPDYALLASRHFVNLFEAPVLFYAACVTGMVTQQTGVLVVALAWAYVAARIAHAYVHLGSNHLRTRINVYFASWIVLVALWGVIVVGVATHT